MFFKDNNNKNCQRKALRGEGGRETKEIIISRPKRGGGGKQFQYLVLTPELSDRQ